MRALLLTSLLLGASACLQPMDDPTTVKDLRVLGMKFEPPEVMMVGCNAQLLLAAAAAATDGGIGNVAIPPEVGQLVLQYAARPLEFKALIADPAGNGRELDYRLMACANRGDRECDNEGDYVQLNAGTTTAGELTVRTTPGLQFLNDGNSTPLLLEVISQDTFRGLGGIRLPVVLELSARDTGEKIYAQKLMVYTCQFFPEMKQNVTPVLPGIKFNGEPWAEDDVKQLSGKDEFPLEPVDFSELEEAYVVPTLMLSPLQLEESWKVTWTTTSGTMSPYNTGGTDFVGVPGAHRARWRPDQLATEPQDVEFNFVVRDGRGGSSWTKRRVRWTP